MNEWNATDYAAKDNLLRVVREQAAALFGLAGGAGAWTAPTACPLWEVRDVAGHLIDVTESYFTGFDAARGGAAASGPLGLADMHRYLDEGAKEHRGLGQDQAMDRLRGDFEKMMALCEALGKDEWGALIVPHKYMGPLPAFFYPVFQLMDYGVHGWDIRSGPGAATAIDADAADLLVPFMFILWQATVSAPQGQEPLSIGIRVSGRSGGDYLVAITPDGFSYAAGDLADAPAVIEFDPGSLVLTAFGRINAGTIHGDRAVAEKYLHSFFRI